MRNKKRLKQVLSLSLALLLSTSVVPVSGATAIRDLNSQAKLELSELERSKLKELNGDKLVIKQNDLKRIRKIDGKLTDSKITTPEEAKSALKNVSNLLGIEDLNKELVFSKYNKFKLNSTYDFQQYYKGLEVVNSCITLVVDNATNESEYLTSSFSADISIDTIPTVTKEEVKNVVREKYGIDVAEDTITLVIYKDGETYTLAWKILTDRYELSLVYLNAKTKEEIVAVKPQSSIEDGRINYSVDKDDFIIGDKENIYPYSGFTVDLTEEAGEYKLFDAERKIYMLPRGAGVSVGSYIRNSDLSEQFIPLAVMHNVEEVYDFYKALGLMGPNGNAATTFVFPEYRSSSSPYLCNAYCSTLDSQDIILSFGVGSDLSLSGARGNFGLDIDIVAHEYTHGVTNNIVQWGFISSYRGELMSLTEAYSDIMGELCDDTREWQIGTDIFKDNTGKTTNARKELYIRDFANPEISYYTTPGEFAQIEGHSGSQVISHAAYLMKQNGVSTNDLKNIWFNSLSYLPHRTNDVKFLDCREAVEKAAWQYYLRKSPSQGGLIDIFAIYRKTAKVMAAFNAVHVFAPEHLLGDFNGDGKVDINDKILFINNFKQFYSPTSLSQYYVYDLTFDGIIDSNDVKQFSRLGDVNLDGVVNDTDYLDFKSAYKENLDGWIPFQKFLADINEDGEVTAADISLLSEMIKK